MWRQINIYIPFPPPKKKSLAELTKVLHLIFHGKFFMVQAFEFVVIICTLIRRLLIWVIEWSHILSGRNFFFRVS